MGDVLRYIARYLLLTIMVSLGHLLLLWLWNPRIDVPAPLRVKIQGGERAKEAVLLFGGDTAPTDAATPMLERFGFEYPFSATLHLLRDADLTVVNLEAAVTTRSDPFPLYKRYIYKVKPEALSALTWAGVDAVSLANNHVMDYDRPGLADTLTHLERAGIAALGAGRTGADARRGRVFLIRDVRVGVLSYMEDTFMHSLYVRSFAWGNTPGCARLAAGNLRRDLERMRRHADLVVVVVHWGWNYEGVSMFQRRWGRAMIDYGADIVIGHHPHVWQPVGMHRGKPILYSLGNFAFGTPGRTTFRYGLLARLRAGRRGIRQVELIPLLVQNRIVRFKPEQVTGEEAETMLRRLADASARLGARIRLGEGVGLIEL